MLPKTKEVLDFISQNDFFKKHDVRFVGGTALSYLINHRLSEDLDFAMLDFEKEKIMAMMKHLGATYIEHEQLQLDCAENEGGDLKDYHLVFSLNDVKVEFFVPQFNSLEKEVWINEGVSLYENSNIKIASFKTTMYMKTMAFWNRKKYRDLFDIYFVLSGDFDFTANMFVDLYLKYNITYNKEMLYEKIKSTKEFYHRANDEGINSLVKDYKSYEWYRQKIEDMLYQIYMDEIYEY